jgi:hypothetical protein
MACKTLRAALEKVAVPLGRMNHAAGARRGFQHQRCNPSALQGISGCESGNSRADDESLDQFGHVREPRSLEGFRE